MSTVRLIMFVSLIALISTVIGMWSGYTIGKRVGFDLAVGYADDDHPPARKL